VEQVVDFRQKCAEALNFDSYLALGEIATLRFVERFQRSIDDGSYLDPLKNDVSETAHILKTILNQKVMTALVEKSNTDPFYNTFVQNCVKAIATFKSQALNDRVASFLVSLFQHLHHQCHQEFQKELCTPGVYAESYHMKWVSQFIQTNLIVIDAASNCVYRGIDTLVSYQPVQPSILLLWKDANHFENIGELCNEMVVKRVFTDQDVVIQRLKKDCINKG
jgi:hypothetical protein